MRCFPFKGRIQASSDKAQALADFMQKPDLDPRPFSEIEIEAITRYVSPWRRVKRFLAIVALFALGTPVLFLAIYLLLRLERWLVPGN